MTTYQNPFPNDADRRELWDMLVRRDIEAFVERDWQRAQTDFDAGAFVAVDGCRSANPDTWRMAYPTLGAYRDAWLAQSLTLTADCPGLLGELLAATTLRDIEISGDRALAHKKFDGPVTRHDGSQRWLRWQTLYLCRRADGRWLINGFVGYLPNQMEPAHTQLGNVPTSAKRVPVRASQHATAGPYSPVLEVDGHRLVVISGQAAIGDDGSVLGETIDDQARLTLENCRRQLAQAGATLADVFKVNVYLRELADWARFNAIYTDVMPKPLPVRTAVGTQLLTSFRVEIEMWAAKP